MYCLHSPSLNRTLRHVLQTFSPLVAASYHPTNGNTRATTVSDGPSDSDILSYDIADVDEGLRTEAASVCDVLALDVGPPR